MDETMQRRRVLIIDGYNVIRNNGRYSFDEADYSGGEGWNIAREALINDAAYYADKEYERCTVVFDGGGNPSSAGKPQKKAGIEVVFSPAGITADSVIEKLAHDARDEGFEVVVVSSDFTIQSTVFGGGVTRMSAAGFGHASQRLEEEWRTEPTASAKTVKNTLAERLDPATAEKLRKMLEGNS